MCYFKYIAFQQLTLHYRVGTTLSLTSEPSPTVCTKNNTVICPIRNQSFPGRIPHRLKMIHSHVEQVRLVHQVLFKPHIEFSCCPLIGLRWTILKPHWIKTHTLFNLTFPTSVLHLQRLWRPFWVWSSPHPGGPPCPGWPGPLEIAASIPGGSLCRVTTNRWAGVHKALLMPSYPPDWIC